MHTSTKIVLGALLALLLVVTARSPHTSQDTTIRGITMSTHTDGRDWSQDGIVPAMESMREIGANWVAIHPYAGVQRDGSIRFWPIDPKNPPSWITRPIQEAHALGLKILIKPHLAYWGSGFSWRGEVGFETPEQWDRFWSSYTEWIAAVASVSQDADGFVVGTELAKTHGFVDSWRTVITEVKKHGPIPLTYAANWHDYRDIEFWDALDVIGIQAYFPIAEIPDADELLLRQGWARRMAELREYSELSGKHIVFTELGYNLSYNAPVEPWDYHVDGEEAEPVQLRCLRVALEAIEQESSVIGSFLWKWFPEPRPVGRNFPVATPKGKQTISTVWRQ